MDTWFISDTHFGHSNIIRHCDRPFRDADHMDTEIIDRINAVVGERDRLVHLGDFARGSVKRVQAYRERLACRRIVLILGNHDPQNASGHARAALRGLFEEVWDLHRLRLESAIDPPVRRDLTLCHYPLARWRNAVHGAWHLHGHTHGAFRADGASLDLSVEAWDYRPVAWMQLEQAMLAKLAISAA